MASQDELWMTWHGFGVVMVVIKCCVWLHEKVCCTAALENLRWFPNCCTC
uniref:Uncharacterized protein n=1 Tax=Arundo donax TaxID=35708 RepID=A0A0A8ZZZ1_ARUDO